MRRQGKYTKIPFYRRPSNPIHRGWVWFKGLSRKQKIALIGIPLFVIIIVVPLLTYLYYARDISDPNRLMNRNDTGVVLLDRNGEVFYNSGTITDGERVPLSEMPKYLRDAVVAAEDKNFYTNAGVSVKGLLGAIYGNFISGDATAYGGSTITQQLVKNTLLTANKSFLRKYQELFLALAVDRQYSKDEILELYINSVHYGENTFGIKEAAKVYFNKAPKDLSLAESTMLVGLLPAPGAYSPISGDPAKAKQRQTYVLRQMKEEKYITDAQQTEALAAQLTYAPPQQIESAAPHFAEMVIESLNEKYGQEVVARSGYRVKTTLDLNWQKSANEIVTEQIAISRSQGGRNAAVVVEDPTSGEIRALIGSSDFSNEKFGQVNMAVSPRQPGSSFKPIYHTEALARGVITPASHFVDEATDFGGYKPDNFDFKFRGDIAVRNSLSQSLNIPSIKVMQKLGVAEALSSAKRLGITTLNRSAEDYGLPLALGAGEVKLTEMVNAYAAFANKGNQFEQSSILEINDKFNKRIFVANHSDNRVMDQGAAYLISNILSDNNARAPSFGSRLNLTRPAAVKTGSTDDNVDAWTIGYTPNVVVGVWVGNNEHEKMALGGSAAAGPIWRRIMERTFQDLPKATFEMPSTVEQLRVCASNGGRAVGSGTSGTYMEYFMKSHIPSQTCNVEPEKPKDSDNDGVTDDKDDCPNTVAGVDVDSSGCEREEDDEDETPTPPPTTSNKDADKDGVADNKDKCPNTPAGSVVDSTGCPIVTTTQDADRDGVADDKDKCPNTVAGANVDSQGCAPGQTPSNPTTYVRMTV